MRELTLQPLQEALAALGSAYHYVAQPNAAPPYLVWMEDGSNDLFADNVHAEKICQGTIDLYTNQENDPLMESVPEALEGIGAAYYLNSVQYEEDTGLIHYEWVWEVAYGEDHIPRA